MDISMATTTVMPTVAALRVRTESFSALGTGVAQPKSWHGGVVRTATDSRTNAKQPHPPRGVPR